MLKKESLLITDTGLSDLQRQLISQIFSLFSFAESLTKQEITFFTPAIQGGFITCNYHHKEQTIKEALIASRRNYPLWVSLLQTGGRVTGFQQGEGKGLASTIAFPVIDNGGQCIGGLSFSDIDVGPDVADDVLQAMRLLAETIYMVLVLPQNLDTSIYQPADFNDGILVCNEKGRILYANESAHRFADSIGMDRRLLGSSVHAGLLKISDLQEVLHKRQGREVEEFYGDLVVEQVLFPVRSSSLQRCIILLKDKTKLREKERELLVKNSVIKEIHHRVKNNLQTVAGLLRMEARRTHSEEAKLALKEGIQRIESMALVHEAVSHYEAEYVDIKIICEELFRLLQQGMMPNNSQIDFYYEGDSYLIASHRATYVSLVINEILTNAFEHAFLPGTSGRIRIQVKEESQRVRLTILDNGQGLPDDFSLASVSGLGLSIVKNLVQNELAGQLVFQKNPQGQGTQVSISFAKE